LWNNYLNPDGGTAKLVYSKLTAILPETIQAKHPGCIVIASYSGGKLLEEFAQRHQPGS
jgi:hypothetical protein